MSITRVSLAELLGSPVEFSAEESAFFEGVTDEDLHRNAIADPDAQPWTDEMFRQARSDRHRRQFFRRLETEMLGAALTRAEPDLNLPIWEITDQNGRISHIKAANIRRVASEPTRAKVLKIEALPEATSSTDAARAGPGEGDASEATGVSPRPRPERQKA